MNKEEVKKEQLSLLCTKEITIRVNGPPDTCS